MRICPLSKCSVFAVIAASLIGPAATAQQVDISSGSIVETVAKLRPGEFIWAPQAAPYGPMLLIVNVTKQRAVLFRNGVPIAATTVSTGRPERQTPVGVFTVLQKQVEHYSSKYDNAPMPYMQRLTWEGVALHAGKLPGYPASHGCIRLPGGFAKLLYGETRVGMTVVINSTETIPRIAPAPTILADEQGPTDVKEELIWEPARAPAGPLSIVISALDRRAVVLRNGAVIGLAPVSIDGPVTGTWIYAFRNIDAAGAHWVRITLSNEHRRVDDVGPDEWARFHVQQEFRRAVASAIKPGTTIVVTSDSLTASNSAKEVTLMEGPER